MQSSSSVPFTHSLVVSDDGGVTFKCSDDRDHWPWLALHPFDPIVVQTINYWVSVETGTARGTFDPTKWSALTQTEWTCGEYGVGHATHGVSEVTGTKEEPRFELTFFDANDALVYRMSGKGVVFHNRDFEAWRANAKKKIKKPEAASEFDYAPATAVGAVAPNGSFLSPLSGGAKPSAKALITKESGFRPEHPYHSGSGDHVNANHLADVGAQFAHLVTGQKHLTITSGEITFNRYVELGQIFDVELATHDLDNQAVSMIVKQVDRVCSEIMLKYQASE